MSREDKNIDNLFQDKLSDRNFDGPPADFLADLNERLDAKPAASKGWVWMIFLNFFIIGLFIANASIDSSALKTANVKSEIHAEEQNNEKEDSLKIEKELKESASNDVDGITVDSEVENKSSNNSKVNTTESNSNQTTQNSNGLNEMDKKQDNVNYSDNRNNNFKKKGNQDTKLETDTKTKSNNKADSNSDNSMNNKIASKKSTDSNTEVSGNSEKGDENKSKNTSAAREKTTTVNKVDTKDEKSTIIQEGVELNGTESLSPYVSYSAIYAPDFEDVDRTISTKDFPQFPNRWKAILAAENNEPTEKKPEEKDNSDNRMFEIQLQGGATQWNFKTLGTNDSYVNQIDQAGTAKWTPNFGLGFNVNLNNISIGTGINYVKFETENLFGYTEVNTYDSTYIAGYNANVTYDSTGMPIDTTYTPYYDSTTVTDSSINVTPTTNQYEWIQIPIHFGYRFNLNKWAIIPRVGANIGLGIRQTAGQFPTEGYDNLQTISPVKWNLNLHTSLEIRREFGNWHAFGKFNYQRNLTPTIDNALFERKFNGIGFNFGVGYSF